MLNRVLLLLLLILPNMAFAHIILIVGDSLSAAYGIPVEKGWVSLLQERLDTRGYPYQIINASISGDTTANARARLPQALASHAPAVVLLELGGNDGLRGLSLTAMKSNLVAMISSLQEAGTQVLLIGVQLPPNYGPRYTERFQAIYYELAEEHDLSLLPSLVDGIGTEENLMQPDGIHPNATAQPLIRDRVWEELLPLLKYVKGDGAQKWFLMARHGECAEIFSLQRKIPGLGEPETLGSFIDIMESKGYSVHQQSLPVPNDSAVEVNVPELSLGLIFVTPELCSVYLEHS